jgi:hypothetical protein
MAAPGTIWTAEGESAAVADAAGARLLDVTDPTTPQDLGQVSGEQIATQAGHRYWLGLPWQAPPPARTRARTSVDQQALEQAQYLIIAPDPFGPALQPLVEFRERQGLSVLRLTPAQVYDTYGDGRPDPGAIRSLVQEMQGRGNLSYLLLVGDASTRAGGYAGPAGALLVVTDLVGTAHLHETPSDQAMVTDNPLAGRNAAGPAVVELRRSRQSVIVGRREGAAARGHLVRAGSCDGLGLPVGILCTSPRGLTG